MITGEDSNNRTIEGEMISKEDAKIKIVQENSDNMSNKDAERVKMMPDVKGSVSSNERSKIEEDNNRWDSNSNVKLNKIGECCVKMQIDIEDNNRTEGEDIDQLWNKLNINYLKLGKI